MNKASYRIPAKTIYYEQKIKRSQFLTWVGTIETPKQAKQWIKSIRDEYPDARHVCWAYIAGSPCTVLKSMSDDGEPNGTAGKPILNVLEHSDSGDIMAIVVRYFGGVKLGTGGLVKAYSSSVSEALKTMEWTLKRAVERLIFNCAYSEEPQLRYLLTEMKASIVNSLYSDTITLECDVPIHAIPTLQQRLPFKVIVSNVSKLKAK